MKMFVRRWVFITSHRDHDVPSSSSSKVASWISIDAPIPEFVSNLESHATYNK